MKIPPSRTILSIKVPKEIEPGPGPIMAEQIFLALHSIHEEQAWYKRLFGVRGGSISLEIIHQKRHIKFIVTCPTHYRNLVEGQIYAHYPNVEIFEEDDYIQDKIEPLEMGKPQPVQGKKALTTASKAESLRKGKDFKTVKQDRPIYGAEIRLTGPAIIPIKRYPQFEDRLTRISADPIAGITSSLSRLSNPKDEAWIQLVMVPLDDKWRVKFVEVLRIFSKGVFGSIEFFEDAFLNFSCTRKVWPRVVFFPLTCYIWLRRKTVGFKHRPSLMSPTGEEEDDGDLLDETMSKQHDRENKVDATADKINKLMYEVDLRVAYLPAHDDRVSAEFKIKKIAGSFKQFNIPLLNELEMEKIEKGSELMKKFKNRTLTKECGILNVEELATIYHFPTIVVQTPNIDWVKSRKIEAPSDLPSPDTIPESNLTLLGKTNYRGMHDVFGIKCDPDRRRHMYIIGKTGMGKTTLLENMIFSDIQAGRGIAVIDPHGDLAEKVIDFVPPHRTNDVVLFDPADREFPVSFNMMESPDPAFNTIICSGLVGIFKKIYAESWGPRLEHILRNTILSLLNYPDTSMLGIIRVLQDEGYRRRVVSKIEDPVVRGFWDGEFDKMSEKMRVEAISPILNKVGQFLSSPIIRNIVGQTKSTIDLRFCMDKKKIVIVNLSKGKIGEDNSSLLGAMLITKFQLDAMSRANVAENERQDFYLYVDEFQNFATESFATILSEARKYRLNLTMANQYIAQMPEEVRDAVFGNVGTTISFQVGFDDAEYISQQFGEVVMPNDLVNLNKYTIYTRLLVDGMPSVPFSADTLPPPAESLEIEPGRREKVIKLSRERYSKPRELVEDKIKRWSQNTGDKLGEGKEVRQIGKPPQKEQRRK
ncbi:MAG: DUF87 domain-containing protein [Candidatus Gracilibacteria bacterium]